MTLSGRLGGGHQKDTMNKAVLTAGVFSIALSGPMISCSSTSSSPGSTAGDASTGDASAQSPGVTSGIASLGTSQWNAALTSCLGAETDGGSDCDARYCELIARTMLVVNEINTFLLPRYRRPLVDPPDAQLADAQNLQNTQTLLAQATTAAETVATLQCQFNLPSLPLVLGDSADPVLSGEVRGIWTPRDAHMLAALFDSISYGLQAEFNPIPVALPADGGDPALPPLLEAMREHLLTQDQLLFAQPVDSADAAVPIGGWYDRNGNGVPDTADELLIDIFKPGTNERVLDYSTAAFVKGDAMPLGALTPTASLPAPQCGYQQFHIDDVVSGSNVLATDGMSFSPDGTQVVVPLETDGFSQIYVMSPDGTDQTCITCGQPGNNDGVRWRRGAINDAMLFISDRDHPYATGNAGGGFGQELYVMRTDGSEPTRLTTSDAWATNYHEEWSPDGTMVMWGDTESYAWDVMIADFVEDDTGMHLANQRVLVHDTTWWETHGFTADNQYVITTNTQAGFMSTDLYAINVATGARTRLTTNPAWDEHGHLSPDGREISWISGRWHPASVLALNDGSISPVFDFLWVIPGIFFEFLNAPAGYSSELTLMNADGSNIHALTGEDKVIADNQWSEDGTRIIFRETDPSTPANATKIRILTFDDCDGGAQTGDAGGAPLSDAATDAGAVE
jgi:Tol biopolymer transport system component